MKDIKYLLFLAASLLFLGGAFFNADAKIQERTESFYLRLIGAVYKEDEEMASELAALLYETDEEAVGELEKLGEEVLISEGYGRAGMDYLYGLRGSSGIMKRLEWTDMAVAGLWVILFCWLLWKRNAAVKALEEKTAETGRMEKELEFLNAKYNTEHGKANALIENIAHQIRTPLTNISLYLEILEEEKLSREGLRQLQSCYRHIAHIRDLIHCLLRTGELEQAKVRFAFESISLRQLMVETVGRVEEMAGKGRVKLEGNGKEDQQLAVDIAWIKEALYNIIGNCIRYSPDGSVVEIEYRETAHQADIRIRDRGIGISEEDRPYIFDRFYRSPDNRSQDGFGIGLNMAKLTVEAHHGSLSVDSGEEGSCFRVLLPVL